MPSSNDITELDLVIGYRDDDLCIVTLTDDAGVPRNISANDYTMHVSNQRFPVSETPALPGLIFWAVTPQVVGGGTDGRLSFSIVQTDYDDIPIAEFNDGGKFRMFYDIVENNAATLQRTILTGKLTVQRTVRTLDND